MKYVTDQISTQRIVHQSKRQRSESTRRDVEIYQTNSRPSWKRFGKGCSNVRISAAIGEGGIPHVEINVSETALANEAVGEKRDVTKETYFTAYGPAALEIYEILREVFEPATAPKADAA